MNPTVEVTYSGTKMVPYLAAQGAAQVGQGILGYLGARRQNRWNVEHANRAMQHDQDMWQLQADYNSPQAQMKRLAEAGLNPNLVYGKPGEATGNMGAPQRAHIPEVENELKNMQLPMVMGLLQQAQEFKNMKEQNLLTKAQTSHEWRKEGKTNIETDNLNLENFRLMNTLEYTIQEAKEKALTAKSETEKRHWESKLKKTEYEMQELLRRHGLTPQDHVGIRALIKIMSALGINIF